MKNKKKKSKLYGLWLSFSIKQKLCTFAGAVIVTVGLALLSNLIVINYALYGFGTLMDDNVKSSALLDAVGEEARAFETYVRLRTEENRNIYEAACERTGQCIQALPFDYEQTGAARYARTWSVRNFYANYAAARDEFLTMGEEDDGYVSALYQIYRLQDYMETYARRLMQMTVQEGNDDFLEKEAVLHRVPQLLFAGAFLVVALILFLTVLMWHSLVTPLGRLAHLSRKIARNEFPKEDLKIENRDEMGELVTAFNKMKHATIGYIGALEEKYEITQLLHREELERVEMEKNLEAARLEVLKSQVNPHFLFNTLNMISCMAKLEEAQVTEKMIGSMSSLFRYNLKMTEARVPLRQEMKVVDDYMYLQQMRFGNRIEYLKEVSSEAAEIMIPSFSLQPIVENAILHGLSKKEQGGRLFVGAWQIEGNLNIFVTDSGTGIDAGSLAAIRDAMGKRSTSRLGIGLGNIYTRLHMMYEGADLQIYSEKDTGTMIHIKIPQDSARDEKDTEVKDVPVIDSRRRTDREDGLA